MSERTQRIDLVLQTIPNYDGNVNELNTFISTVSLVHEIILGLEPALDNFVIATVFLTIRSKITGRALQSIKELDIRSWAVPKEILINNFADKSNLVTVLNSILNIKDTKNPSTFLEIVKNKFKDFKSRLYIEYGNQEYRKPIIEFTEKLIIIRFITNLIDPYRNNLTTRNPKSLDEVERLVKND